MTKIIEDYKKLLAERQALHLEDDYGIEENNKKAVEILSSNLDDVIDFIENECSYEDFVWMSEIFDDLWLEYKKQGVQNKFAIAVNKANKKFVSQGFKDLEDFVPYIEEE